MLQLTTECILCHGEMSLASTIAYNCYHCDNFYFSNNINGSLKSVEIATKKWNAIISLSTNRIIFYQKNANAFQADLKSIQINLSLQNIDWLPESIVDKLNFILLYH